MTPAAFARLLPRYAAAYDAHSWRVARLAHDARESDIQGWAEMFGCAFERGPRWAQTLARVYEMGIEFPLLRGLRYTKAVALFPYLMRLPDMTGDDARRLLDMAQTFARSPKSWTLERIRAELGDAFGAPEVSPAPRWRRYAAMLFSDAERMGQTDRAARLREIATALKELGKRCP